MYTYTCISVYVYTNLYVAWYTHQYRARWIRLADRMALENSCGWCVCVCMCMCDCLCMCATRIQLESCRSVFVRGSLSLSLSVSLSLSRFLSTSLSLSRSPASLFVCPLFRSFSVSLRVSHWLSNTLIHKDTKTQTRTHRSLSYLSLYCLLLSSSLFWERTWVYECVRICAFACLRFCVCLRVRVCGCKKSLGMCVCAIVCWANIFVHVCVCVKEKECMFLHAYISKIFKFMQS